MPILTYTDSGTQLGGLLNSRVLIGRRLSHGVVLSDPSVSRLHAWIDPIADENAPWVVSDAGSKTGTFVNEQPITNQPLHDGDTIRVGNVTLTYHDQETLPEGVTPVELSSPEGVVRTSGILFECACGAPMWVGNQLAGKRGMCRHCRQPVTVPELEGETSARAETSPAPLPAPPPAPPAPEYPGGPATLKRPANCAICHSAIAEGEPMTTCAECAMTYHADCWQENLGCSTYGCKRVNVLHPNPDQADAAPPADFDPVADEAPSSTPWEPILLAASVVGTIVGSLLFGGLAALVAIFAAVILIQGKARRPALVIVAVAVSLVGIAVGLGVSDFWYFNAKHLPAVFVRH
jgi:pSer/pThr/pTyr-binding forkhead associated (FHA) protein